MLSKHYAFYQTRYENNTTVASRAKDDAYQAWLKKIPMDKILKEHCGEKGKGFCTDLWIMYRFSLWHEEVEKNNPDTAKAGPNP